jgi:3-isopropylmalate/(R)-2-methylmalate dehydratase large subunit
MPKSLFDRLWESHEVVAGTPERPALLYVDLHLVHEVTSPQAFAMLRARNLPVRRPARTLATIDHSTPTLPPGPDGRRAYVSDAALAQVEQLEINCRDFDIPFLGWDSPRRGVVHVIGPELGLTQPGMTIVCGDSHTSTHGAFGALAFGIGTTQVGHVLATQCLLMDRPKSMAVTVEGCLRPGVTAKDLILALIARIGVGGATGHVIEYRGEAIRSLTMEERMTVCNMSIEAGARAGLVAPDETTVAYLRGRPMAPDGAAFDAAAEAWLRFESDPDATFDRHVRLDADRTAPMITWGTNPGQAVAVDEPVPGIEDAAMRKALAYMAAEPGKPLLGRPVDMVFLGSCTNGRLSDLRAAASLLEGRTVAPKVRMLVVPGSADVKRCAEEEGLDRIFRAAGAEWREAGCSMCIAMNGDMAAPGQLVVSTSNRNFEGRQGAGARTVLASPLTAAAAAVTGRITDPRTLAGE